MTAIQLEFNIENESDEDHKLYAMQKQIDCVNESMGKVRRKLFSELGEMKKLICELRTENQNLQETLKELKNEKLHWSYAQGDTLFNVAKH